MDTYKDARIECTESEIRIRGYYVPWGAKRIPYGSVRGVQRAITGAVTGKMRIWGTGNPRYWANLDPKRPRKQVAFLLDVGRHVKPFVTPDDPEGFSAALLAHLPGLEIEERSAPFI